MSFGERIKNARERKKFSQRQLADFLGVTDGSISNYEKGVAFPRCETIKSLCDLLGVEPNYLFWDDLSDNLKNKIIEENCLKKYASLNFFGQKKVDEYIEDLLMNPKYTSNITEFNDEESEYVVRGQIAAYGGVSQAEVSLTEEQNKKAEKALSEIIKKKHEN